MKKLLFCGPLLALAACSDEAAKAPQLEEAESSQVTGTVWYRERMMLPPGSTVEVSLLDTSKADVPAVEIARQEIADVTAPPIPFAMEYDAGNIDERMSYSVRANIRQGGQLLFTTDTNYPVLTRGHGSSVDVMLVRVSRASEKPNASLTNTYWKLVSIGEVGYVHESENREPHIKFADEGSAVSGFGGCNSFTGTFETDGDSIRIGPLAATQRACIEGMDVEREFFDAMESVTQFSIRGDTMHLYEGDKALLGFEAVYF